ncbi:MAG TPA: DNA-processing protein DprA, partial [Blastocatellia bacterium]|nr:DNA-processing protein DprA [Blastocatellia bacterium]
MDQDGSLLDWVALSFVTGVGARTAAMLIDRFGTPAACFDAGVLALESAGLRRESIEALRSSDPRGRAEQEIKELARLGAEAISLADPRYPALLRETYDPPIVLYCLGDLPRALAQPPIAVVGSRRCSTYGRNVAEMLGRDL